MHFKNIHADHYAGIDVHSNRSQVCIMEKTGKITRNRHFQNSITALCTAYGSAD